MTCLRAVPAGIGSYLPARVLTNDDLSKSIDTTHDWIVERTGIHRRHIAAPEELTSDLALKAAQNALEMAGMNVSEIDMIIVATATPDQTFPSTATRVQHRLGMTHGFAFDVQAVCSGFVYALSVATQFIETGKARGVIVIGAETFSRILDWTDRATCVLFGDGAGALVLRAQDGTGTTADRGVLSTELRSDGTHNAALHVDGGPSSTGIAGHLRMNGREVFKHAVRNLAEIGEAALTSAGLTSSDVQWIVPHQANARIIASTAQKMGIGMERVVVTVQDHANTSAASIPLALDVAVRDGRIRPGDLLLMEAMGGGFTWGGAAVRW